MSNFSDSGDRDRIVRELGTNLFVEAGAGTGKTTSLVDRLANLVTTKDNALRREMRSVVATTFTRKAAGELKERLEKKLQGMATKSPRAIEALKQLDEAYIGTIHGFAQRILTQYAAEAGLPIGFKVEESVAQTLGREEEWEEAQDLLVNHPNLPELLDKGLTISHLREIFFKMATLVGHADRVEPRPDAFEAKTILEANKARLEEVRGRCSDPTDLRAIALDRLIPHIDPEKAILQTEGAEAEVNLEYLECLETLEVSLRGGAQSNWGGKESLQASGDAVKLWRTELSRAIRIHFSRLFTPLAEELFAKCQEQAARRRAEGRVRFDDLLSATRDLLRRNERVRRELHERWQAILVDEFQDTDPIQEEIVRLIAAPADSLSAGYDQIEGGRIFYMGDPKQSIYMFRGADLRVFGATREQIEARVSLVTNFRSVPNVLCTCNSIFAQLFDGSLVEPQSLEPAIDETSSEVKFFGGPMAGAAEQVRTVAAQDVCRLVAQIKDSWLIRKGTERVPAQLGDIALLFPKRSGVEDLIPELEEAGFPVRVESKALLFASQEAADLLNILRALADPFDQVALVGALRSAAFGVSDVDLAEHAKNQGKWSATAGSAVALIQSAFDRIETWRKDIHRLRTAELLERIVTETGLDRSWARGRDRSGSARRIRQVIFEARKVDQSERFGLPGLIRYLSAIRDQSEQMDEVLAPEEGEDAVRAMTVHAAKGLEFPIVIVAGLDAPDKHEGTVEAENGQIRIRAGQEGSWGTRSGQEAHEDRLDRQHHERIRCLYVALTRAKDHLAVALHRKQDSARAEDAKKTSARLIHESYDGEVVLIEECDLDAKESTQRSEPMDPAARAKWEAEQALAQQPPKLRTKAVTAVVREAFEKDADEDVETGFRAPSGSGTAVGLAVHSVMQSIDLAQPANLEASCRAHAEANGIPDKVERVVRMVHNALKSDAVQRAARADHWRETFCSSHVAGTWVEAFIDLVFRNEDGHLEVVDYKTDSVRSDADVDKKMERYRLQAYGYALMLRETLGEVPAKFTFVFVQPERGAIEREVTDLLCGAEEFERELSASLG